MRSSLFVALLSLGLLACGGGSKNDVQNPGDVNEGGSLIGQKNSDVPLSGVAKPPEEKEPTEEEKKAADAAAEPEPIKKEPPKPPGQDLPAEERDRIIKSRLTLGAEAEKRKDADGMIREAMGVLDVEETNVDAMIMLAHGYYLKGNLDKCEAVLTEALKQEAALKRGKLWMLFGLVYDKTDREDQALVAYTKATESNPNYAAAWTNRGVIMQKRKVFAGDGGSVACFEKALNLTGRNKVAKLHLHLGSAYRGLSTDKPDQRDKLLRDAETEFKAAITLDPNYAAAYFNLSLLYFDADPFPGLEKLNRLSTAMRYMKEYQRVMGAAYKPGDKVEEYLATAQKAYEQEEKAQKRKRDKEEKEKAKKAKEAADAANKPPADPPPPPADGKPAEGTPPPADPPPPPQGGTP
jgi:tetratricopeptide (TPR) repeat protein